MTSAGDGATRAPRETPLAAKLKARIRAEGPISVRDYMHACLQDAEHGYYRGQTAIGKAGDFTTAPEISQIFGELIGLWSAVVWQQMGAPPAFNLVELGPGRGTLMRDLLRASGRAMPAFIKAARVLLIESSATLAAVQRQTLEGTGVPMAWHDAVVADPLSAKIASAISIIDAPTILIANEYLDAQPIDQLVFDGAAWRQRVVALDAEGNLAFATGEVVTQPEAGSLPASPPEPGDILELSSSRGALEGERLAHHAHKGPVAALYIDYGHPETAYGDTLQAVRRHAFEHPLACPGEADLSAQVDFAAFRRDVEQAAGRGALVVDGPLTQGAFLASLGISERAARLIASNPALANEIEAGVARLLSPTGMGTRFKVIGVRSRSLPPLPGLPAVA